MGAQSQGDGAGALEDAALRATSGAAAADIRHALSTRAARRAAIIKTDRACVATLTGLWERTEVRRQGASTTHVIRRWSSYLSAARTPWQDATPALVQDFLDALARCGHTPASCAEHLECLRRVYHEGIITGAISSNPTAGLRVHGRRHRKLVRTYYGVEGSEAVLAAADATGGYVRSVVYLALVCLLRRGEIGTLRGTSVRKVSGEWVLRVSRGKTSLMQEMRVPQVVGEMISAAARCALSIRCVPSSACVQNLPYPSSPIAPVHIQHAEGPGPLITFSQKRVSS